VIEMKDKIWIRHIDIEEGMPIDTIHPTKIIGVFPHKETMGMNTNKDGTTGGMVEKNMIAVYFISYIENEVI